MTLIEAAFVFPVTFIVVFLIIMMGNVYFQHAAIERGVVETALNTAASSENPMMAYILENKAVPTSPDAADVMPYRYLFSGNIKRIAGEQEDRLYSYVNGVGKYTVFRGLKPIVNSCTVKTSVNLIFSQVEVNCDFDIALPLKMIFTNERFRFHYQVSMKEQIGDSAEFVRNTAMIKDYFQRNKALMEMAGNIGDALNKIKRFMN